MSNPQAVNRARAAEMIGRKPATLRAWAAQNPQRGPRPTKTGTAKQAHTIYEVGEITAWLADPAKLLSLDMIERDPLVEPRIEPIGRHIFQAIAWSIRNGISPPPIRGYAVGPRGRKRFLLVDGRNRIAATRSTGEKEIMAEIVDGTIEEAAWVAAGLNGRPQQTRSPAEVRRAVSLAIRSAPRAADKRIAEH